MRSLSYKSITLAFIFAFVGAVLIMGCTTTGSATSGALANTTAPSVVRGQLLSFNIVRHTRLFDVVSGHAQRFVIRHGVSTLAVRNLGRCTVVRRTARLVVLRSPVLGALDLRNAHDLVFENVDFQGRGSGLVDSSGLVLISGASHNITFRNCIIGTNQDGVGNGVEILDVGRGMHDITFDHCRFAYQPRMGFECNGRADPSEGGTGGRSYYNVNLTNCTFEPSAGQAISYDDNTHGKANRAGTCTVAGNLVKGAGVGSRYRYGRVFEINGNHDMIVTGNTFYAGRDGILNLNMHDTSPCGWVFSKNVVDATHIAPRITVIDGANPVLIGGVYGGRFAGNTIINGHSGSVAWITGCHNMDWRTTRWLGPRNVPDQAGGSSGNLL